MLLGFASSAAAIETASVCVVPEGVNVQANIPSTWKVNEEGILVSDIHRNYGSAVASFVNSSNQDLCCSFWWSVSSEVNSDRLGFSCDGSQFTEISGEWRNGGELYYQLITCYVKAGSSVYFRYVKDGSSSKGDDCGYIKGIEFSLAESDASDAKFAFSFATDVTKNDATVLGYYGDEKNVIVPSSVVRNGTTYQVKTIAYNAFGKNENISSVQIQSGITTIDYYAFQQCTNLVSVEIPNSVTSLGQYAFEGCTRLENVNIPNTLRTIDSYVFSGCKSLKNVNIPSSVRTIASRAFYECSGITSLNFPSTLITLEPFAFGYCTGIKSLYIPRTLYDIRDNPFVGCSGIESIVLESGNRYFDSRNNCNAIIYTAGNVLVCGCKNTIIPQGVELLDVNAFGGCTGLTSINLPTSVKGVSFNAFENCTGLKSASMPSVKTLGQRAFSNCISLESVEMTESLGAIGPNVFYNCSSLRNITIPNSVVTIGAYAFASCKSLTSITIPESVYSLEGDVFAGCSNLKYIEIKGRIIDMTSAAFRDCGSLSCVTLGCPDVIPIMYNSNFDAGYAFGLPTNFSNCTLFVPKGSEEAYRAATGWKQFGSVNTIAEQADYGLFVSKEGCGHAGHQMALQVEMNNVEPVSFWQADVVLPEGFKLANATDAIRLNEERIAGTDISVRYNVLEDGTVRIVASSRTGNAFVGSEGWVASLAIEAPYDAKPGDYFAEFRNVNFIDPMKQSFGVSKYISKFSIIPNAPGDVNADGAIDEDDVRGIAGFIVNKPLEDCSSIAADIDSNGIINIIDCVKEVNNILK